VLYTGSETYTGPGEEILRSLANPVILSS